MPELLCEHSIRNKILTKLFHVEKASKRHSEKQMLWKIATSLKSIMPYSLTTAFSSKNLLSNAAVLTFHVFIAKRPNRPTMTVSLQLK